MFGVENYSLFIVAAIFLIITPGNDTLYILGRSISMGRKAGILSALGITLGCIVHTVLVSLGVSAILAESTLAFNILKYLGVGYLVYLGIRAFLSKSWKIDQKGKGVTPNSYIIFFQGTLSNVLNPKVLLFFLAFLPQFVSPGNSHGALPFLFLGLTFVIMGSIWCIMVALFSAYIAEILKKKMKVSNLFTKIAGIVYIGLGLSLLRAKLTN